MRDTDIAKFDETIQLNSTMDDSSRRALHSGIRKQIARNFDSANKKRPKPVCRYCRLSVGSANEYIAFVVFSEASENVASTSSSQDKADVVDGSGENSGCGKTGSADDGELWKKTVDSPSQIEQRSLSDKWSKSEIKEGAVSACRSEDVADLRPETSGGGELLPQSRTDTDDVESTEGEVTAGQTEPTDLVKGCANGLPQIGDLDVSGKLDTATKSHSELDDVGSQLVEPEAPAGGESDLPCPDTKVEGQSDLPDDTPDVATEETMSSQPTDAVAYSPKIDSSSKLYAWKSGTKLRLSSTMEDKDMEFERLSEWLGRRIGSTTAVHRFPSLYHLPVLGPLENPEQSVTWRLAEQYGKGNPSQDADSTEMASDVIFVGPNDSNVVSNHREVLRRVVAMICDNLLPRAMSDVLCVSDVGVDVSVTAVSDIISTQNLSPGQFNAYTVLDTESNGVSCVLLKFCPV